MDPRARRQAIREYLSAARAAVDRGDRRGALEAINAALELDPAYLAAQTFKERVERSVDVRSEFNGERTDEPHGAIPDAVAGPAQPSVRSSDNRSGVAPDPAGVSPEGWARFENRARARRIDKRVGAAQAAIARGRFSEAKEIIEEIRALDSAHPDLISLAIELDAAVHSRPHWTWRFGPAAAAIVVFGAMLFGARYLGMVPAIQEASRTIVGGPTPSAVVPPAPASTPVAPALPTETPSPATTPDLNPEAVEGDAAALAPSSDRGETSTASAFSASQPATAASQPATAPGSTPAPDTRAASAETPSSVPIPADRNDRGADVSPAAPTATSLIARTPSSSSASDAAATRVDPGAAVERAPSRAVGPIGAIGPIGTSEPSSLASAAADRGGAPVPETRVLAPAPVPDREREPAVAPAVAPGALSTAAAPPAYAAAATVPVVRDEDLVRETLQVYRRAYESLDAQSARAVWPRVDGAALQRAFDGLASQRLMFDSCQVQVRGNSGSAVCRGTTRYVPKVGSRDPRVEPRTWTFSLHKSGDDWQIDSARAER